MNISPSIPLTLGIIAGSLFVIVFVVSAFVARRNRRIIRNSVQKD